MFYYIKIKENKIIGKYTSYERVETKNTIEITKDQYDLIEIPHEILNNNLDIQYIIFTQIKKNLITKSKTMLAEYLQNNPLLFTDDKYYSVTAEKQSLLNNAIAVYQMKIQLGIPAELKWNSTGEECTIWTLEDITALALAISEYVEPLVTYQQAIEVQIRNCTTREELESVVIDYEAI